MSEDLTKKLPGSEGEIAILTALQNLDTRLTSWVGSIDSRLQVLETQVQALETKVQALETKVQALETKVQALETKVQALETKVDERLPDMRLIWHKIDSRLRALETKVEERLHDTRPIWHKVVADIAQLQAGQQRLEKGVSDLTITVGELSRDQMVISDVIRKIHLDFHNIDQRLHTLELNRNQQNSST